MPESTAKVNADFSGLINETAKATKGMVELAAKIASFANPVGIATTAIGGMVNVLGKVGLAAQGVEAIGKSAVAMAQGLLKGNASAEMVSVSFKTLLGSAAAAAQEIQELTKFAANTPFNLPGLETMTQRLLGAQYSVKEIIPLMTALGDTISAMGGTQDNLNSLVYVFSQMRNEAHLNAGDIMQMANQGVPALQMLADHFHKTTGEVQEMISKGLIPGKEAAAIFQEEMEKRYAGMMAAQSQTFNGMISNLQDWATATTMTLTKPFFEPAKKGLASFLAYVQSPAGVAAIDKLAGYIQVGVDKATAAFTRSLPQIKLFIQGLVDSGQAILSRLTPGVTGLIPQLEALWQKLEPLAVTALKVYDAFSPITTVFAILTGALTGGVAGALDAFQARFNLMAGYVRAGLDIAIEEARKYGPRLLAITMTYSKAFVDWIAPTIPLMVAGLAQISETLFKFALSLGPQLVTILLQSGRAIGVELRRPVSEIILVFHSLVDTVQGTVLPAFLNMVGFLKANLFPILDRLAIFTAGTIIPTLGSLAAFAMNVLVPAFVRTADLLGLVFGPSLVLIGSLIRNDLLPWLTALWQKFDNKYLGQVQTLASRFGKDLAVGIGLAVERFQDALPALEGFYKKIEPIAAKVWEVYQAISPLSIALDVLKGFLTGGVQGGLDAFGTHMTKISDLAQELIPKLLDGLTTALPKVFDWISDQAPKILQTFSKWGESFGKLVDKVLPPLLKALGEIGEKVLTWIVDKAPDILNSLLGWAEKFGEFAKKTIPILLEKLGDLIVTLMKWLGDKSPEILSALGEWTGKFVEWGAGLFKKLYPELVKLMGKIWDWLGEKAPELASKLGDWAGAFLQWVVTDFIPGWVEMAWKIETTILKFIGSLALKIGGAVLGWVPQFLGFVGEVVRQLPGKLWDIVTGIGSWVGNAAGSILRVAGDIGGKILEGIVTAIHDAPGKIWDAVTGVLGSGAIDIIKGVVRAVANFFVDVVNTPINLINTVINALRDIEFPLVGKILGWLSPIPKLGYMSFASGTGPGGAPGGLSLVGEDGVEMIRTLAGKIMLTAGPTLLNLPAGTQVYNNQQTRNFFSSVAASPQQIHNMYANSHANTWDNSVSNSHNNQYNYYGQQQTPNQMSPRMQRVWYGRSS